VGVARSARKGYLREWTDLRAKDHVVGDNGVQRILRWEELLVARRPGVI